MKKTVLFLTCGLTECCSFPCVVNCKILLDLAKQQILRGKTILEALLFSPFFQKRMCVGLDIYLNFRNRGLKIKLNVLRAEL